MITGEKHVNTLRALVKKFETESGDVVIGNMIPEIAALMVALSDELDKAQRRVVRLTWALLGLPLFLAVTSVAHLGLVALRFTSLIRHVR